METHQTKARGWHWGWIAAAFVVGIAVGFFLCICVGIYLTAATSYAQ